MQQVGNLTVIFNMMIQTELFSNVIMILSQPQSVPIGVKQMVWTLFTGYALQENNHWMNVHKPIPFV